MVQTSEDKPFGRPLKFQSVEELQKKIDKYFASCDPHWVRQIVWEDFDPDTEEVVETVDVRGRKTKRDRDGNLIMGRQVRRTKMLLTPQIPYNIVDLAIALGTNRETLRDYEKAVHDGKDPSAPEGLDFSDTIKTAKQRVLAYSERGLQAGKQAAGIIFSLKNNFNYKDKTEVEEIATVTHKYEEMDDEQLDAEIARREAQLLESSE